MKFMNLAVLAAAVSVSVSAFAADTVTTDKEKISYAIGMNMGQSLKQIPDLATEIDLAVLVKALNAAATDKPTALTTEQAQQTLQTFSQKMSEKAQAQQKLAGEKNATDGAAFMASNKSKPGVKTTASGIQ